MEEKNTLKSAEYWNKYYDKKNVPLLPSQFSIFVLGDKPEIDIIIDVGCGNGRDTFFFAERGIPCLGIDGSETAITICTEQAKLRNLETATFLNADVSDVSLYDKVAEYLSQYKGHKNILIYSRFFIHAISDEEEAVLASTITKILNNNTGTVALEFRTKRDQFQVKITSNHFRRYIDPVGFFSRMEKQGFSVEYFVEGFGMAKYKSDDAHVARFFLNRSSDAEMGGGGDK